MTTPSVDDTLHGIDVELAQFGGVDLSSATQVTTYVGMLASALGTTHLGQWAGLPSNARIISSAAFGLICITHIVMRYIHHGVVEKQNTALKQTVIAQAAAQGTSVQVDSPPAITGTLDPVAVSTVDNTSPTASVGMDLPTVDSTATVDSATPAPVVGV